MSRKFAGIFLQSVTLLFSIGWLTYMMLNNEVPTDTGDGIMHFFISQASWINPAYFLDHWGKPVFILLTSPFAQFGFNGMVVFNILVFSATILIAYSILNKRGVSPWLSMLFPLLLIKTYDVSSTILGGLTEPLFNLALVGALYFLLERKFNWFALLVSFMPFMRSEGQLPIVLALVLLLLLKEFKSLPYLFVGFVLYSLVGWPVFGDFFWYFTESPYKMDNNIYGSGPWYHYLISYDNYLGKFGLLLVISGMLALMYLLLKRKWNEIEWEGLIFTAGLFFGVLFVHSYFWATGQNGSLGLTRIATQGMPAFLILNTIYLGRLTMSNSFIFKSLCSALVLFLLFKLITSSYFPKKADPLEKEVLNAAEFLKSASLKNLKIYYHFPLFSFAYGENSLIKNGQSVHHSFTHLDSDLSRLIQPGDIIVRDSHFGPQEMHLPLTEIAKHKEFVKIKEFISSEQVNDRFNETEGVIVYQYIPLHLQKQIPEAPIVPLFESKLLEIQSNQEFTNIQSLFSDLSKNYKVSLEVTSEIAGLKLVYDFNNSEKYSATELKPFESMAGTYLFEAGKEVKLYIWNPEKKRGKVKIEHAKSQEIKAYPFLDNYR